MTIALNRCANYSASVFRPSASAVLALVNYRLDEAELHCERAETKSFGCVARLRLRTGMTPDIRLSRALSDPSQRAGVFPCLLCQRRNRRSAAESSRGPEKPATTGGHSDAVRRRAD